ncbi:hypothetical protein MIMGU_mgv1a024021mg, partial [Erythranthe guttata]
MAASNIPREIIEIILSKLPSVKPLLRFKTVSKSWNTLISDLVFIQTHLHSLKTSPDNLFLSRYKKSANSGFPMVKFEGGKVDAGVIFVENIPNSYNAILCECNGVLLLTRYDYDEYALWNPSTRETFPINYHGEFSGSYILDYGVCYDQITADFKVVFVSLTEYEIYSCNKNSWTKKNFRTDYYNVAGTGSGIFLDGATYWIFGEGSHTSGIQLVYFDPRTDEIKRLQKPKQLSDDDKYQLIRMDTFRGSLCLYCYNNQEESVQIWIKEKGIDLGYTNWKEFITVRDFKP